MNKTITATVFEPPNAKQTIIDVKNILPEDAEYINENDIKVSMEQLGTGVNAVYFDDGVTLDDGTPDEIIVLSDKGQSCEECMTEGVDLLKKRKLVMEKL